MAALHDPSTAEDLLAALRITYGSSISYATEPRRLSGGFWAEMFVIELAGCPELPNQIVARVMPEADVAEREMAVQAHLAEAGFPTPLVHASVGPSAELGRAWALMDLASGAPLLDDLDGLRVLGQLPKLAKALPDQLGRLSAQLHAVDPSALQSATDEIDELLTRIADHGTAANRPDLARRTEELRRSRPKGERTVVCHGDLHPLNVLADGTHETVLDWSATRLADPAYDLAYTAMLLRNPPLDTPGPLRPFLRAAGRALHRRFHAAYIAHGGSLPDASIIDWYERLHRVRIDAEIATWAADGELDDRAGHPFLFLAA